MNFKITESTSINAADLLDELNKTTNNGRGSSVARSVACSLRRKDLSGAHIEAALDFDKIRQYPEMADLFVILGLAESD